MDHRLVTDAGYAFLRLTNSPQLSELPSEAEPHLQGADSLDDTAGGNFSHGSSCWPGNSLNGSQATEIACLEPPLLHQLVAQDCLADFCSITELGQSSTAAAPLASPRVSVATEDVSPPVEQHPAAATVCSMLQGTVNPEALTAGNVAVYGSLVLPGHPLEADSKIAPLSPVTPPAAVTAHSPMGSSMMSATRFSNPAQQAAPAARPPTAASLGLSVFDNSNGPGQLVTAGSLSSSNTVELGLTQHTQLGRLGQSSARAGTKPCASCCQLEAQILELALRCRDSKTIPQRVKDAAASLLLQIGQCRQQCLITKQLPSSGQIGTGVLISHSLARLAGQGDQRASAGTAMGRNINYKSNSPCEVQSLGAATGVAGPDHLFTVISSDRRSGLTAIALMRLASDQQDDATADLTRLEAGLGTAADDQSINSSSLWANRKIRSNKEKWKHHEFDLYKYAVFFSKQEPKALALAGSKRKAAGL